MLILFPAVRRCSPTSVRRPRVPNQLARRQHGLRRPDSVPATRGRWIAPRWPRLPQRWHGLVRRQRILVSLQLWQSCVRLVAFGKSTLCESDRVQECYIFISIQIYSGITTEFFFSFVQGIVLYFVFCFCKMYNVEKKSSNTF